MSEITFEDFKLAFLSLVKNKWIILLVTMAGFFAGMLYTSFQTASYMYQSTATVCVSYSTYSNTMSGSIVMSNYSDIVVSNRVCEYAARLLDGTGLTTRDIQSMVSVRSSDDSYVMSIRASSPSPELAIRVANAVAESFVSQVSNLSGNLSIQVLDSANNAVIISDDKKNQLRIMAAMGAFAVACGWIALRELFSKTIRSIPQCVDDESEILALIPYTD